MQCYSELLRKTKAMRAQHGKQRQRPIERGRETDNHTADRRSKCKPLEMISIPWEQAFDFLAPHAPDLRISRIGINKIVPDQVTARTQRAGYLRGDFSLDVVVQDGGEYGRLHYKIKFTVSERKSGRVGLEEGNPWIELACKN